MQRHIRLHPVKYHIPREFHRTITTKAFAHAVSKALTTARAEIKRKVCCSVYLSAVISLLAGCISLALGLLDSEEEHSRSFEGDRRQTDL